MKSSGLGAEIVVVVEEDMVGATKTRLRTLVLGLVEGSEYMFSLSLFFFPRLFRRTLELTLSSSFPLDRSSREEALLDGIRLEQVLRLVPAAPQSAVRGYLD